MKKSYPQSINIYPQKTICRNFIYHNKSKGLKSYPHIHSYNSNNKNLYK